MSRQSRIDELKRHRGPQGEASSRENLDYWSRRAERNSFTGGPSKPGPNDTGVRAEAKRDLNSDGDVNYARGIRRQT